MANRRASPRDDALDAFVCCADVVDIIDVVQMAIAFHDDAREPFKQLTTVLGHARKLAVQAREITNRAHDALNTQAIS